MLSMLSGGDDRGEERGCVCHHISGKIPVYPIGRDTVVPPTDWLMNPLLEVKWDIFEYIRSMMHEHCRSYQRQNTDERGDLIGTSRRVSHLTRLLSEHGQKKGCCYPDSETHLNGTTPHAFSGEVMMSLN